MSDTKRKYIFIDESGDPGIGKSGASKLFSYNIIMLSELDMQFIEKELAYFRFYEDKYKELKTYTKDNKKLLTLLQKISERIMMRTYLFHKSNFKGTARGITFRNYTLRKSLESFFEEYLHSAYDMKNIPALELVIDRYLDGPQKDAQEVDLKKYLNKNYNLPNFSHITMVDSKYTPAIQILDIAAEYLSSINYHQDDNRTKIIIKGFWKSSL